MDSGPARRDRPSIFVSNATTRRRAILGLASIAATASAGCQSLPSDAALRDPIASATFPRVPDYGARHWAAIQGLPLRRGWLKEGRSAVPGGEMMVLPHVLTTLPYKNVQETSGWVEHVNATYRPDPSWRYLPDWRMGHYKCMSLSASTIIDWFNLEAGRPLGQFRSLLSGATERGFDHRKLDALYYARARDEATSAAYPLLTIELDPVEQTPIAYRMAAFVEILSLRSDPVTRDIVLDLPDPSLPGVVHRLAARELPALRGHRVFGYRPSWEANLDPGPQIEATVRALETSGPLYAGLRLRFATSGGVVTGSQGPLAAPDLSAHGVVIVGYVRQDGRSFFIYRETFGEYDSDWADGGPAYRLFPIQSFNEAWAFDLAPALARSASSRGPA